MKLDLQKGSRSRILAAMVFGIMTVFAVRLFYLQIIQHDHYVAIANQEQLKRLTIPAKRGLIYALDGSKPVPLVMNQTVYTVFADPQMITEETKIAEVIERVAGGNMRSNIPELLTKKDSRYQILATKLTRSQADKIKDENLRGVGFQEESQRVYPEGMLAAQTLGFVDYDGVGRYGVENGLNNRLTGTDGLLQSVTDVRDVPLTIGNRNINQPAVDGDNVVLSIDRNIQAYVEKALDAGLKRTGTTKGSAVVIDPNTGRIMAMANLPTYDPSQYNTVQDAALFNNDVVSAPYEPGSVIKTFTFATGLEKGVITPQGTYVNTDSIKVRDRTISNATLGQTGTITFQHALNWSLNTAAVTVVQRLGDGEDITRGARDILYDYFYNKFRLGRLTGLEVSGEVVGRIISPDEPDGNAVRYANMSFGQGLDVTMVQAVAGFSALVNGGLYYTPTVVAGVVDGNGVFSENKILEPTRALSESAANQTREMMHAARSTFFGSVDKPGYNMGGKTGTSETIKDGTYTDDETIATYLGYGGGSQARYVIMIRISGEGRQPQGARDAMPIFTDISNWMIDYLKVQPEG